MLVKTFKVVKSEDFLEQISNSEKEKISSNFLHESILQNINLYKLESNSIYEIFGIYFLTRDFECKFDEDIIRNNDCFYAYCVESKIEHYCISNLLRGSNSFKQNEHNSYINSDIEIYFDNNSFVLQSSFDASKYKLKFEKTFLLMMLLRAYLIKFESYIKEISDCYEYKNFNKMLNIRDDYLEFNLKLFFKYPVTQTHRQMLDIYSLMYKIYKVSEIKDELKDKSFDLIKLIDSKNLRYKQEVEKKIDSRFNWLLLLFSILSIFGAWDKYRDLYFLIVDKFIKF